ncbi:hypothetical protein B0H34DRAFT_730855 [Crassisporium funariophilum]|nr:hypothetical protein B0H34DRAFT_730855 [Crassisporium funariophilum]
MRVSCLARRTALSLSSFLSSASSFRYDHSATAPLGNPLATFSRIVTVLSARCLSVGRLSVSRDALLQSIMYRVWCNG